MDTDKRQKIKKARRKQLKKVFVPFNKEIKGIEDGVKKIKEKSTIKEEKNKVKDNNKIMKLLTPYNIIMAISIILIITSLYIIFKPNKKFTSYGVEIVQSNVGKNKELTEDEARKIAVKQFEKLNEKVEEDSLEVIKLERENELYYYISSEKNTMEVRIKGGEVTRINAVPVKE